MRGLQYTTLILWDGRSLYLILLWRWKWRQASGTVMVEAVANTSEGLLCNYAHTSHFTRLLVCPRGMPCLWKSLHSLLMFRCLLLRSCHMDAMWQSAMHAMACMQCATIARTHGSRCLVLRNWTQRISQCSFGEKLWEVDILLQRLDVRHLAFPWSVGDVLCLHT